MRNFHEIRFMGSIINLNKQWVGVWNPSLLIRIETMLPFRYEAV